MAYASWSVSFGEQPSAAKWNILGTNDAYFDAYIDRAGFPVQIVGNSTSAVATGTTTIPVDDTIPQNTEGTEFITQAITPTSATNKLKVTTVIHLSHNTVAEANLIAAIFQDSTANALAAGIITSGPAGGVEMLTIEHIMTAGTTSATTFKVRGGSSSAGTVTNNGGTSARLFGATSKSALTVTEYKV